MNEIQKSKIFFKIKYIWLDQQVTIMVPTSGIRAWIHVLDVKFDDCSGKNVLCTSSAIDLRRNFNATFSKFSYIQGFMTVRYFVTLFISSFLRYKLFKINYFMHELFTQNKTFFVCCKTAKSFSFI